MKKLYFSIILLLFFVTSAFAMVNINKATVKELSSLPGIGQIKAEAIMQYRKVNGEFKNKDDLIKVKGIGPKLMEKINKDITVGQ